ncbi:MAG: hypothetical protein JWO88_3670 [Frankiales bacterium]|nr:hypothetical protein [Frankiales bacterium]
MVACGQRVRRTRWRSRPCHHGVLREGFDPGAKRVSQVLVACWVVVLVLQFGPISAASPDEGSDLVAWFAIAMLALAATAVVALLGERRWGYRCSSAAATFGIAAGMVDDTTITEIRVVEVVLYLALFLVTEACRALVPPAGPPSTG